MSDQVEIVEHDDTELGTATVGSSLEARMSRRREEIEQSVAEVFPVPGWEDIFAVRLRKVSGKRLNKLAERHKQVRDKYLQTLYIAADQIVAGTTGFYDLADFDGEVPDPDQPTLEGASWERLARGCNPTLNEDLTARQAVISLVMGDEADQRLAALVREWVEWMENGRAPVDRQLARDFRTTR